MQVGATGLRVAQFLPSSFPSTLHASISLRERTPLKSSPCRVLKTHFIPADSCDWRNPCVWQTSMYRTVALTHTYTQKHARRPVSLLPLKFPCYRLLSRSVSSRLARCRCGGGGNKQTNTSGAKEKHVWSLLSSPAKDDRRKGPPHHFFFRAAAARPVADHGCGRCRALLPGQKIRGEKI